MTEEPAKEELSESEKAVMRMNSLYIVDKIVSRYGGSVEVDLATYTLIIDVPEKNKAACAREIEEQVGKMIC